MPVILAGLGVLIQKALEAAAIGAIIGALFGGAAGGAGGVISGVQEHGTFNSEVAIITVQSAAKGAAEGALIGGAFGAVGVVAAPIVPAVGGALQPALGIVDDVAKPVVDIVGKAARPVFGAIDDIAGPTLTRTAAATSSAANHVGHALAAPYRIVSPVLNGRNFLTLPRAVCSGGCLYVMDDAANAASKIGVTTNPAQRLSAVQRDVRSKLNYVGIMPADDAYALEGALHRQYTRQNIPHPNHPQGSEWFNLSGSDEVSILSK